MFNSTTSDNLFNDDERTGQAHPPRLPEALGSNESMCGPFEPAEAGFDAKTYAVGVASLIAYSPEMWMILDGREDDQQLVLAVLDLLQTEHNDLGWVALDPKEQTFKPFEKLFDAAEVCDLNREMVVACKASKNGTFLRIAGEWVPIIVPAMAA